MRIARISSTAVAIPYAAPVGPYIGRGGGKGTLGGHGLIVKIETDQGLIGWGEGTGRCAQDLNHLLKGREVGDVEGICQALEGAGAGRGPMSGVEMALWDLLGKKAGLPLCLLWGGRLREEVEFCACMGLKEPSQSAATAREYMERWGFRYLKTKAGDDPEQDLKIAEAIQKEIGDQALLRPDANAGYAPEVAEKTMGRMRELGVRLFEDPCASEHAQTLARIRRQTGMAILVNMGVETADSVKELLVAEAADFLMPDTPAAGGLLRVRKVAAVAEAWGVPCLMHCSHDLGLKTAAIAHVAAATPNFSGPNDTCYHGLVDDVLVEMLRFAGGKIKVPQGPGLGVEVDEGKVEQYRTASA
jgi:L-alanine-DL-glutamate epimerase-like enolase superfamily enzyme